MSATVRVVVVGDKAARAKLRRAAVRLDKLDRPTREAAQRIADLAGRLAPKRTGRLSRGNKVTGGSSKRASVVNRVRYAPYVEYGTEHMREEPFIRPAARLADVTGPFEDHADRVARQT